jgi:hypothetical protein
LKLWSASRAAARFKHQIPDQRNRRQLAKIETEPEQTNNWSKGVVKRSKSNRKAKK